MRKRFLATTLFAILLTACNETTPIEEKAIEQPIEQEDIVLGWGEQVTTIAANKDDADKKFHALEAYMTDYKAVMPEIELFKANILASYKDKSYLTTPTDHEKMLTLLFQAYVLKTHLKDEAWQAFLIPYYDNVTLAYRMKEEPTNETITTNEMEMTSIVDRLS